MSYPPPVPQQHHVQIQQPVVDKSRRFLNLSGGALLAITSGLLLVCCVLPVALCLFTPVLGMFGVAVNDATKAKPQVEITSCEISSRTAKIGLRVTNPGAVTESFTISVEVHDGTGARVGDGSAYVSRIPAGGAASDVATVYLDADGGASCHVTGAS